MLAALPMVTKGIIPVVVAEERTSSETKSSDRSNRRLPLHSETTGAKHPTISKHGSTGTAATSPTHRPPNFVIVLADDLDWTLGGAQASTLERTRKWLGGEGEGKAEGRTFSNWFVQTPVCCASRAELLTGKMYHNLKVAAADEAQGNGSYGAERKKGCMHVDVEDDPTHPFWDRDFFSNYLASVSASAFEKDNSNETGSNRKVWNLDYSVGIFGKLLNTHNPTTFVPNGVDEMLINGGGEYLNPTFTHGMRRKRRSAETSPNCDDESDNKIYKSNDLLRNLQEREDDEEYETTVVERVTFDNCTEATGMPCYSTSVIGNASLAWIERQVLGNPTGDGTIGMRANCDRGTPCGRDGEYDDPYKPFFAFISVKAPHIQDGDGFPVATPAPWYQNVTIPETRAPRTPNYNATAVPGSPDRHHWLIRNQTPLNELEASKVDELYVSRLKTLLSVDDLVEDLMRTLGRLGVLDSTYVFFTSDNGYRLGQFRMPQCKLHPYENDVRVPMMIRGPGISPCGDDNNENDFEKIKNSNDECGGPLFSHVDLMPTLFGLATGQHSSQKIIPETMDGTNLASWILDHGGAGEEEKESTVNRHSSTETGNRHQGTRIRNTWMAGNKRSSNATKYSESIPRNTTTKHSSSLAVASQLSTSLLIEYTSLGNVVRYQHLVDTYNHSFVALRIMPRGRRGNTVTSSTSDVMKTQMQANRTRSRVSRLATKPSTLEWKIRRKAIVDETTMESFEFHVESIANLKYIEFRDCRVDWTNTKTAPLERELYDLDLDPYELNNLIQTSSPSFLDALAMKTRRLMECVGESCRTEQSYGLGDSMKNMEEPT